MTIRLLLLALVCVSLLSAQTAPPAGFPPSPPAASLPGTLTLPVGTVCRTDAASGRPVCVMPPESPSKPPASPSKPTDVAPPPKCPSFYAAGADYTLNASPKWTGWAAIATLFPGVTCNPSSGFQPRSISQYVVRAGKVNGLTTLVTTTTTGIALPLQKLGPINVYVLGTVGSAVNGSTSVVNFGSSYGAVATVPLKGGLMLTPALQWVNGTRSFWIGFGRGF